MTDENERCLWRAVSIAAGDGACPAARRYGASRFLAAQAPALPVADCDTPDDCDCVYRHHADRRVAERAWTGVERRGPIPGGSGTNAEVDRSNDG